MTALDFQPFSIVEDRGFRSLTTDCWTQTTDSYMFFMSDTQLTIWHRTLSELLQNGESQIRLLPVSLIMID